MRSVAPCAAAKRRWTADAALGKQDARARLQQADRVVRDAQRGKTAADVIGRQLFVRQLVTIGARARAGDDGAVGTAGHQAAGAFEQAFATHPFEIFPRRIRPLHHRHILRMLEVGLANDARVPVRRTQRVRRRETIDPEHALAAAREMIHGGAAHRAKTGDDDIEMLRMRHAFTRRNILLRLVVSFDSCRYRNGSGCSPR